MTIFWCCKPSYYLLGVFLINLSWVIQGQNWYDIRLVDGYRSSEGRVEMYYLGSWGTICDDGWGTYEADVVCRQLGYDYASSYYHSAYFGEGTGNIWLDDVTCWGYESELIQCSTNGVGDHNCGHYEDVSVKCYPPSPIADLSAPPANSLRLVDGSTTHEGRLEVYHNGEWGTVCDDFFDADDATVACRQLGFPGYDAFYYYSEFGEGLGRVWIANLFCNGNETELVDCDLYWEPSLDVCPHSEDVGVRCTDPDASEGGEEGSESGNGGLNAAEIAGIAVGSIIGCCILLCIIAASCKGSQTTPNPSRSVNNIVPITYHNNNPTMNRTEPDEPSAPPPSYDQLNKYSSYSDHPLPPPPPPQQQAFDPIGGNADSGPYPAPSQQGMGYPVSPSGQSHRPLYHGIGGHHAGAPGTRSQYPATSAWQAPSIESHPSSYPPPGIPEGTGLHPSHNSSALDPAPPLLVQPAAVPQAYSMYIPTQQGDNIYASGL